MWVATEPLLDLHGKRRHALAHIRLAGGYPDPCPARNRDHALSSRNAATSKLADTPAAARMVAPRISMTSTSDASWLAPARSARTATAAKPLGCASFLHRVRRQR